MADSTPARGITGRESLPIWVGYLVRMSCLNTGCEIKYFKCFFMLFTIFCCWRSSCSSLPLPEKQKGTVNYKRIQKHVSCVHEMCLLGGNVTLPIKTSSSKSTSRSSAAFLNQELWLFSLPLWNSIFSISLAKRTLSCERKPAL